MYASVTLLLRKSFELWFIFSISCLLVTNVRFYENFAALISIWLLWRWMKRQMNWICVMFYFSFCGCFLPRIQSLITKWRRWLIMLDLCWYILFIFASVCRCLDFGYGSINYLLMVMWPKWFWLYSTLNFLLSLVA